MADVGDKLALELGRFGESAIQPIQSLGSFCGKTLPDPKENDAECAQGEPAASQDRLVRRQLREAEVGNPVRHQIVLNGKARVLLVLPDERRNFDVTTRQEPLSERAVMEQFLAYKNADLSRPVAT